MLKFISFLGTGKYVPCNYYLDGIKVPNRYYIQDALANVLKQQGRPPDKIVVFTTDEAYNANWIKNNADPSAPGLEQALKSSFPADVIKNVNIPSGKSEQELWDIFQAIIDEIELNDEIVFDVTHSWRFLPMLAFIVLNYARIVKNCAIASIYYGAFEALNSAIVKDMPLEARNAPVFDLTPFVTVFDWTLAIDRYLNTGDASMVSHLAQNEIKALNAEIKATGGRTSDDYKASTGLKKLAKAMEEFSDVVHTCRGKRITPAALNLKGAIDEVMADASHQYIKPLSAIIGLLEERFDRFMQDDFINAIEASKWCLENSMYQQGLTILEEGIISYICDICGKNKELRDDREWASICAGKIYKNVVQIEDVCTGPDAEHLEDIMKLLYEIASLRNDINHAGWRDSPADPAKIRSGFEYLLRRAKELSLTQNAKREATCMRMFLIFSHELTQAQIEDAEKRFGISKFISLPQDLAQLWSNVPPELENLGKYLSPLFEWLDHNASAGDYALVQGDYGATLMTVDYCFARGITPVYSTTERSLSEEKNGDAIIATREFRHVAFREYKRLNAHCLNSPNVL